MGNSAQITDLRGFEANHHSNWEFGCNLSFCLEECEEEIQIAKEEGQFGEEVCTLAKEIRKIPNGGKVLTLMQDAVTGSGALAIGWDNFDLATSEALYVLEKLLKDSGFVVERLKNDRFAWYG